MRRHVGFDPSPQCGLQLACQVKWTTAHKEEPPMTRNNSFTLRGFVGNDAEIKTTDSGRQLAQFSVCVEERWQARGEQQSKKEWFRLIAWGRQAEIAQSRIKKGTLVEVHGRLEHRSWSDSNGQKHYATDLIVLEMVFIDRSTGQPIAEAAEAVQPVAPVPVEEAPKPRRRKVAA
jgi:single-strand DNA-binding protein